MGVLSTKLNELKTDDISDITVSPSSSTSLVTLIDAGKISSSLAKEVWLKAFDTGKTPAEIIAAEGLTQIDDESQIVALIADVVAKNEEAVAKYRAGNAGTFGFLVGQVMKAAAGKANPKRVNELLKRALGS
jgi:aspartyl-tRNA(Asn)/glutamyl-tRNA(Gln) amidotransferase subunit B